MAARKPKEAVGIDKLIGTNVHMLDIDGDPIVLNNLKGEAKVISITAEWFEVDLIMDDGKTVRAFINKDKVGCIVPVTEGDSVA